MLVFGTQTLNRSGRHCSATVFAEYTATCRRNTNRQRRVGLATIKG